MIVRNYKIETERVWVYNEIKYTPVITIETDTENDRVVRTSKNYDTEIDAVMAARDYLGRISE